ncbi:MAG TPA: CaiB/BaiF CoA-transferase family protein [Candidatus Acidoferrales bacterium]|nr:CaiB/BaiF CoA-transferase family protein [Candidatus Acidoferrales bacterium]
MLPSLLDGVRVLSVGHTLPAMYCIPVLRDLGADVTLVEAPAAEAVATRYAGLAGLFPTRSLLAGTAHCTINLRDTRGRDAYLRLARQADVILEGFRPGASTRLGVGYDTVKNANPTVVYAAISGYGQDGPARQRVGHDLNYLAASGVLHLTGEPGGPPAVPGVPFADGLAGLSAALNVVAALWRRDQTGTGCYLDIAIVDGPAFLMAMEYDYFWNTGRHRQRGDTHLCGGYPWYHVFETADGRYLSVAAVEPQFYARLCHVLGRADLASRQFVDGPERQALFECFAGIFRSKTCDEWMELLGNEDVCVAPVLTPGEAAHTMQVERTAAVSAEGAPLVRSPVRLEAAATAMPRGSAATLASFGFTEEEIRTLLEHGSVTG